MAQSRLQCGHSLTVAGFLMSVATVVVAQATTPKAACGTDSAKAASYRRDLRTMPPGDKPSAEIIWSPDLCTKEFTAARDFSAKTSDTVFVYTLKGTGRMRYAVITYWGDVARKGGE